MTSDVDDRQEVEYYQVSELGKGLDFLGSSKVALTPAFCERFLKEHEQFKKERGLIPDHVEYLLQQAEGGTFSAELVQLAVCEFKGKTYRMNGMHTCHMGMEFSGTFPEKAQVLRWRAKSYEDMKLLYARFDRNKTRTKVHVVSAILDGDEKYDSLRGDVLRVLSPGFQLWKWENKGERRMQSKGGDKVAFLMMTEDYDLTTKVGAFLNGFSRSDCSHIFRASVVAAMLSTFEKAPGKARKFWDTVATGFGANSRNDPAIKLSKELERTTVGSGARRATGKKVVTDEYMFRMCILAWNKWVKGDSLKQIRVDETAPRQKVLR